MKKTYSILPENEKNRATAEMTQKLVGDRTLAEVSKVSKVPISTISKLMSGIQKPKPETIKKLTASGANPQGKISYDKFMHEAGYQTSTMEQMANYLGLHDYIVDNDNLSLLIDKNNNFKDTNVFFNYFARMMSYDSLELKRSTVLIHKKKCEGIIMNAFLEKGISIKRLLDIKQFNGADFGYEVEYNGVIFEWWFIIEKIYSNERNRLLTGRVFYNLLMNKVDKNRKISIISYDDETFADLVCYEGVLPFKGELSIILVNLDDLLLNKECYISHYGDFEEERKNEIILMS